MTRRQDREADFVLSGKTDCLLNIRNRFGLKAIVNCWAVYVAAVCGNNTWYGAVSLLQSWPVDICLELSAPGRRCCGYSLRV
jgi:hypothetical protein